MIMSCEHGNWAPCDQCDAEDAIAREISDLKDEVLAANSVALLVSEFLELIPAPPEPNCHCFISPPCNDCVEYAGEREIRSILQVALSKYFDIHHARVDFNKMPPVPIIDAFDAMPPVGMEFGS
jgi:hypothetical protein